MLIEVDKKEGKDSCGKRQDNKEGRIVVDRDRQEGK